MCHRSRKNWQYTFRVWMWKSRKKTSGEGGLGDSIPKSLPKEGARGQVWDIWSSDRSQGCPELVVYV